MQYAGVAARRYHEDKLGARVKVRAADRIQYAQFNEAMRKARDERTEKRLLIVIVRQSVKSVRSLTPPDSIAGISARFPNRNSTSVRSLGSSCLKLRAGAGSLRLIYCTLECTVECVGTCVPHVIFRLDLAAHRVEVETVKKLDRVTTMA